MQIFIVLLFVGFIGILAATLIAKNLIYLLWSQRSFDFFRWALYGAGWYHSWI